MNYRIVLTPDADADIGSIFSWYQNIDPDLAARFMSEGRTTMVRIPQFPYGFPLVNGAVRRARLKRFPYGIYYSLRLNEAKIIAILHQRRSDEVWRQRSHAHR
jgi:plasmid stabilization system protein ParE